MDWIFLAKLKTKTSLKFPIIQYLQAESDMINTVMCVSVSTIADNCNSNSIIQLILVPIDSNSIY